MWDRAGWRSCARTATRCPAWSRRRATGWRCGSTRPRAGSRQGKPSSSTTAIVSWDRRPSTRPGSFADMDDVRLTDLEVIQRYSIAVRGETADRAELVEALRADLAFLEGGR